MSHKRAALTVYRALLRQARQVPQGASLIIRNPVDIEAFQRNPYSWAQPADGAPRGRQGPAVAQRIQVLTRLCFPAEICRETLKDITPFSTKVRVAYSRIFLCLLDMVLWIANFFMIHVAGARPFHSRFIVCHHPRQLQVQRQCFHRGSVSTAGYGEDGYLNLF